MDITTNLTEIYLEVSWDPYFSNSVALIYWLVFVPLTFAGVVGNILVIFAVLTCRKMRASAMNVLLANLAIADVSNLIFSTFDWLGILLNRAPAWTWPPELCMWVRYAGVVCLYTSLLTQVVICAERYVATLRPLHVKILCSRMKILMVIAGVWIFSMAFGVHQLRSEVHYLQNSEHSAIPICGFTQDVKPSNYFKMAEFLVFYLLPLILLTTLYFQISRLLWSTPKFMKSVNKKDTSSPSKLSYQASFSLKLDYARRLLSGKIARSPMPQRPTAQSINQSLLLEPPSISVTMNNETETKIPKSATGTSLGSRDTARTVQDFVRQLRVRRRVVLMLIVCVAIYFICYSPIQIFFLSSLTSFPIDRHVSFPFMLALNALCYSNSACNPLVYTVFSERFRRRMWLMVRQVHPSCSIMENKTTPNTCAFALKRSDQIVRSADDDKVSEDKNMVPQVTKDDLSVGVHMSKKKTLKVQDSLLERPHSSMATSGSGLW